MKLPCKIIHYIKKIVNSVYHIVYCKLQYND
jgi:hypothetical protein